MTPKPHWKRVHVHSDGDHRVILMSAVQDGMRYWLEERWTDPATADADRHLVSEAYWSETHPVRCSSMGSLMKQMSETPLIPDDASL